MWKILFLFCVFTFPLRAEEAETVYVPEVVKGLSANRVVVQKGDTLYKFGKEYQCSLSEIISLNNLQEPYTLSIGQELTMCAVPGYDVITLPEKEDMAIIDYKISIPVSKSILIQKGDTLYSLSKKYQTPIKDLILRNELQAPYILSIGQTLYLPGVAYHTVGAKETIYGIARAYGVGLRDLIQLNKLSEPYILSIDQKVYLPSNDIVTMPTVVKMQTVEKDKVKPVISTSEVVKKVEVKKTPLAKVAKYLPKLPERKESKFLWPLEGKILSSFGGKKDGLRNDGINISGKHGSIIQAAENGVVVYAGNELKGMGNLVILKHADSYMTIYAHADQLLVGRDQVVKRGSPIARVGSTGRVTTPQLHFELRQKTKSLNPLSYLGK